MGISYKQVKEKCENLGIELLCKEENWKGIKNKVNGKYITHKYYFKDAQGHEFYRSSDSVFNNNSINCIECSKTSRNEKNLILYEEAYKRIVLVKCIPLFTKEEWEGTHKKYWFTGICDHKFYRLYTDVARGRSIFCDACANINRSDNIKISEEEYLKRNEIILSRQGLKVLTFYSNFNGMNKQVKVQCTFCNEINDVAYVNIWNRQDCCTICGKRISYGEAKFIVMARNNGLYFEGQAKFKDLKDKDYLKIDFLSESAKIAIEIQSNLHDGYNEYFHKSYEDFLDYQRRDKIKKEYLENNGYEVIYLNGENYNYDKELSEMINKLKVNKNIKRIPIENISLVEVIKEFSYGEPIVSYYANTGMIKREYSNVIYASEVEGINRVSIYDSLNNKSNHAKGLIFRYKKDNSESVEPLRTIIIPNVSGVIIVKKTDNQILYFKTLKEGSDFIGISNRIVSRYLMGKGNLPKRIGCIYEICRGSDYKKDKELNTAI